MHLTVIAWLRSITSNGPIGTVWEAYSLNLTASVSASSVRQNRDALQDLTGSTDPLRPAVAQKLYYIRNKV